MSYAGSWSRRASLEPGWSWPELARQSRTSKLVLTGRHKRFNDIASDWGRRRSTAW